MRRWRWVVEGLFLIICAAVLARANVTITNYNGLGVDTGNRVASRDVYGNALDAHSSHILDNTAVDGLYYLIGESHGCGFLYTNHATNTACGLSVYSSPTMQDGSWVPHGLLIDAQDPTWSVCSTVAVIAFPGCYRPQMFAQPGGTGKYVLWIQTPSTAVSATIALCDTPKGPCVKQADPTHISPSGVGDFSICTTCGANLYLAYRFAGTNEIFVQQLAADGLDATGSSTDVGATGEAVQQFGDGTSSYVLWSNINPYPGPPSSITADTFYRVASAPLGTYGATVTRNNCGEQLSSADVIIAGGQTNYILRWDGWVGPVNQGLANYAWQPISPSGGVIPAYSCPATVTILGITPQTPPNPWPPVDQSNYPSTNGFWQGLFVNNSAWYMQTFVPTKAGLASIGLALGQGNSSCGTPCTVPDGGLQEDLVPVTGTCTPVSPGSPLASIQLSVAHLKWAPQFEILAFGQTLTPAAKYGVITKPYSNTVGGFSLAYDDASNDGGAVSSYPAGDFCKSIDAGSTWVKQTVQSALFSTFPPVPGPALGTVH